MSPAKESVGAVQGSAEWEFAWAGRVEVPAGLGVILPPGGGRCRGPGGAPSGRGVGGGLDPFDRPILVPGDDHSLVPRVRWSRLRNERTLEGCPPQSIVGRVHGSTRDSAVSLGDSPFHPTVRPRAPDRVWGASGCPGPPV